MIGCARNVTTVQQRVAKTETEKTAWMTLAAGLLGLNMAGTGFQEESSFTVTGATSSDEMVMTATTSETADGGQHCQEGGVKGAG